jgi:hypothetical protein
MRADVTRTKRKRAEGVPENPARRREVIEVIRLTIILLTRLSGPELPTHISPMEGNKISMVADSVDKATFVISDEDHTLGNALRYILIRK